MSGSEDAALMAEIARLSGQIDQHKTSSSSAQAYQSSYHSGGSSYRGRGARGATRGYYRGSSRGGHYSSQPHAPPTGRHRTLVLNNSAGPSSGQQQPASSSTSGSSQPRSDENPTVPNENTSGAGPSAVPMAAGSSKDGWVKRKTTHNMSLVSSATFEKTEPARLAALQATRDAKAASKAAAAEAASQRRTARTNAKAGPSSASSSAVRRGDNMGEVIIDGIVFVFDPSGTKLVKKEVQPGREADSTTAEPSTSSSTTPGDASPTKAPLRASGNGQAFVRTKTDNLISAELLEKRSSQKENNAKLKKLEKMGRQIGEREKIRSGGRKSRFNKTLTTSSASSKAAKGLCNYFTKTGQCKRGLSCPFAHDPSKLAICPGALRTGGCTQPAGLCPLSHELRPQRVPHCMHFLRSGGKNCRNGDDCPYSHPDLSAAVTDEQGQTISLLDKLQRADSVCLDFARLGWCERGKLCDQRHTFDCPDFIEKGSCERPGCRLQHVVRTGAALKATTGKTAATAQTEGEQTDEDEEEPLILISGVDQRKKKKSSQGKRKRGEQESEESAEEEDQAYTVTSFAEGGKKRSKAFTKEKDYIGFDDDEEEDEEEESDDDDDDDDGASVSSEDEEEQKIAEQESDSSDEEDSDEESSSESSDSN